MEMQVQIFKKSTHVIETENFFWWCLMFHIFVQTQKKKIYLLLVPSSGEATVVVHTVTFTAVAVPDTTQPGIWVRESVKPAAFLADHHFYTIITTPNISSSNTAFILSSD